MPTSRSRLTAQGQISVPAEIRRKLGIGAGAVLEWAEEGGQIVVRRVGRFTSEEIHREVFGEQPPRIATASEMREGIKRHMKARHARR